MPDRLQYYNSIAIRSNKYNLKGMQSSTKAALFHVASNKGHNLHYPYCRVGSDSWCKYNKDRKEPPITNLSLGSQYPLYWNLTLYLKN